MQANTEGRPLTEVMAGIEQRFVRWLHRDAGPVAAVIGVENGWFVGDRQVLTERVWIRAYRTSDRQRSLDLEIYLVPLVPLSLQGAGGKSYGGLTIRYAPRENGVNGVRNSR